jgi:hypothetical protein
VDACGISHLAQQLLRGSLASSSSQCIQLVTTSWQTGGPLAWNMPLPPPHRFISPGQQLLYGQVSLLIQCIQLIAILIAITLQSQEGSRSHSQTLNAGRELGPFQWWRW